LSYLTVEVSIVPTLVLENKRFDMSTAKSAKNRLPSRQQYEEVRKKYRIQLLRSVNPTTLLLSALSMIEEFEERVLDNRLVTEEKVDKILSLPADENYGKTIDGFIKVLRDNGHAHVADVFTEGSNENLMADDIYRLLLDKVEELCNYLDPECSIVTSLISKRVFTWSDEEKISGQTTASGKVVEMVKIISRKSNSSYQRFIDTLKQKDQEHIVYILTGGKEGSRPISREDLKVIRKQRQLVIDNMESAYASLVSTLMSMEVFTDNDRQRVEAKGKVRYKRNEEILNILVRKSSRHFDNFIKALKETNQEHVAELFEALTIKLAVNVNEGSSAEQSIEEKLKETFAKDLEDEESEISRYLDSIGIHGAGVESGSIKIWFKFLTREALDEIQNGKLDKLFRERYRELFTETCVTSFHIPVVENEIKRCRKLLESRQKVMAPQHQDALRKAAKQIVDKLRVGKNLLDDLALCPYRQDAILNQESDYDKVRVLLEVMACRPDREFQPFVDALRRRGCDAIGKNNH